METSKRRQIPTTKACPNFSFRGLRKKNSLRFFATDFRDGPVTLINYALVSSGNPVRAHTGEFAMAAAGRAYGPRPGRAAPGIMAVVRALCAFVSCFRVHFI